MPAERTLYRYEGTGVAAAAGYILDRTQTYRGQTPCTCTERHQDPVGTRRPTSTSRCQDLVSSSAPGCSVSYVNDPNRAAGHRHHQALRAPGSRLIDILYGCLRHYTHPQRTQKPGTTAKPSPNIKAA